MASVACPFCYDRIDQGRLAYVCLGRGVPGGTKCQKAVEPTRQKVTGVRALSFPVFTVAPRGPFLPTPREAPCEHCQGPTAVRACPTCHTPVSQTFQDSKSPLIGMVGGKGAGKTVYLSVLHRQLRTEVRRRFRADIRLSGDQQGGQGTPKQWLETHEHGLFRDGKLFAGTAAAVGGMRAPVVMEWRQPRRRLGRETLSSTVLSFYDAAGEELTDQDHVHTMRYLGISDGLVLLLDPWQLPGARQHIDVPEESVENAAPPVQVLSNITGLLRSAHKIHGRAKIKVPLAVVFAKMDAFYALLGPHHPLMAGLSTNGSHGPGSGTLRSAYDEAAGIDTHEHVKAMLFEYGADDIDGTLYANYSTYRYFAVSALGVAPDYATDTVDVDRLQPYRVEEPLLWLLSRFDAIDRSTR